VRGEGANVGQPRPIGLLSRRMGRSTCRRRTRGLRRARGRIRRVRDPAGGRPAGQGLPARPGSSTDVARAPALAPGWLTGRRSDHVDHDPRIALSRHKKRRALSFRIVNAGFRRSGEAPPGGSRRCRCRRRCWRCRSRAAHAGLSPQ
jgi:hypothetical protein